MSQGSEDKTEKDANSVQDNKEQSDRRNLEQSFEEVGTPPQWKAPPVIKPHESTPSSEEKDDELERSVMDKAAQSG